MVKELQEEIKPYCENLTSTEHKSVRVLFDRCSKDKELREVMTAIRGIKPEYIIKHYFRKK